MLRDIVGAFPRYTKPRRARLLDWAAMHDRPNPPTHQFGPPYRNPVFPVRRTGARRRYL